MCDCVGVVRKGHARCNDDLGKCSKNAEIKSTPLLNLKPISPAIYWCMRLCAMMFCVRMRLVLGLVQACHIAALKGSAGSVHSGSTTSLFCVNCSNLVNFRWNVHWACLFHPMIKVTLPISTTSHGTNKFVDIVALLNLSSSPAQWTTLF